jgi:hypothetical protein
MRRLLTIASILGFGCLHAAGASAQTCSNYILAPADGRVIGPITNDGMTVTVPYFQPDPGRSYSIEVLPATGALLLATPVTGAQNLTCPATESGSNTVTTTTTPRLDSSAYRVSVTATNQGFIVTRVNSGVFTYSVSETTLYNSSWSTAGSYGTQWGLQNSSNATVEGTLTVRESFGGSATYTKLVTLPPNSTTFVTSFDTFVSGPIPAGRGGSATFAHNAPPNVVQGDVFIVNAMGTVVFPSVFRALRDGGR